MSVSVVNFDSVAKPPRAVPLATAKDSAAPPDSAVIAACEAARAARSAFDEAASRGEGFGALCELSQSERNAVSAVCGVQASTPAGIAEKALLLDSYLGARRSEGTQDMAEFALSLANDAVRLAKALAPKAVSATRRFRRTVCH